MHLTPRQQRFVQEYLVDLNGRQAAIRAGFSGKTADAAASRLLRTPKIAAAIDEQRGHVAERTGITQEGVILELSRIALGRI